jgi:hypothetical protein
MTTVARQPQTGGESGDDRVFRLNGAAQESNLPTVGLRRLTGFEDQLGHRARPLRAQRNYTGRPSSTQLRVR